VNQWMQFAHIGIMVALGILAFAAHAMFIFGGRYVVESKERLLQYLGTSTKQKLRNLQVRYNELRDQALDTFADYHRALTGYNESHPNSPIAAGPFPEPVRTFINEGYGREILGGGPDGDDAGPAVPAQPPDPTPPSGDGAPDPTPPSGDGAPDPTPPSGDGAPDGAFSSDSARPPSSSDPADVDARYQDRVDERRRDDADGTLRP